PTAAQIAAADDEGLRSALGLTGARARTVRAAAALLAEHPAPINAPHRLDDALPGLLTDVAGIGPWTMSILGLRTAGDSDALPASDLVLRRAMGGITPREVTTAALAWQPYRSYAVVRLWAQDGQLNPR